MSVAAATKENPGDPYVRYLRAFFARWSPLYDAFAAPIGFVYEAAARAAVPASSLFGWRVLDLCTGTGELALRAARRGGGVTAVDFTPAMLLRARAKARRRGGAAAALRWLEMAARALAVADAAFDTAVLSFALHDMPAEVRRRALAEACRVARESVVILDYETAASPLFGRPVERLLATFETAYLRGFLRDGGVSGALADAGLVGERLARPLPGCFALWRVATGPGTDGVVERRAPRARPGFSRAR